MQQYTIIVSLKIQVVTRQMALIIMAWAFLIFTLYFSLGVLARLAGLSGLCAWCYANVLWTPEAFPGPNLRFPMHHHRASQLELASSSQELELVTWSYSSSTSSSSKTYYYCTIIMQGKMANWQTTGKVTLYYISNNNIIYMI